MWSEAYTQYIESLVKTNRGEYPYYVAHTCTYWGVNNSAALPSFKIYFSKEPITASGLYTYVLPSDTVVYSVIGGNANSNTHTQRVTTSSFSGKLNIDEFEFVYSNAAYSTVAVQPDVMASSDVSQTHFDAVSLILLTILLGSVIVRLIRR